MQLDWRPILPRIRVPCLNLIGRQSAVFPWQGTEIVGRLVPTCRTVCALWCLLLATRRGAPQPSLSLVTIMHSGSREVSPCGLSCSLRCCTPYPLHTKGSRHGAAWQVVFENCGHWLYLEQPETFNRLVAEFAAEGLSSVTFGNV